MRLFRIFPAVFLLSVPLANAQPSLSIDLADPDPAKWDAFGHVSWLAVNKTDIAPEWNRWYDVATVGGSLGRFFGPHLKADFDAATSASADVYTSREIVVPGQRSPIYISQPLRFRMTTLSGGASYQFFENRWFHPVAGAGVEAGREVREVDRAFVSAPLPPGTPLEQEGTSTTWRTLPYGQIGFKWFVGERGFFRSDIRATFDSGGVSHVSWRSGFGFEF